MLTTAKKINSRQTPSKEAVEVAATRSASLDDGMSGGASAGIPRTAMMQPVPSSFDTPIIDEEYSAYLVRK